MPSQSSREPDTDVRTRRQYLAAIGAAGTVAVAGCSGGGGGDDDDDGASGDDDTPTDDTGASPSTDDSGDGGSGGDTATPTSTGEESTPTTDGSAPSGCPLGSLEYERREIPMTVGEPVASCEVPASGPEVLSRPGRLTIDFGAQINVSSRAFPNRSVADRATEPREQRDLVTVTNLYDRPSDTFVVSDPDGAIPSLIRVSLPSSGGTVGVAVSLVGERECASAIQDRVVTTAQVV